VLRPRRSRTRAGIAPDRLVQGCRRQSLPQPAGRTGGTTGAQWSSQAHEPDAQPPATDRDPKGGVHAGGGRPGPSSAGRRQFARQIAVPNDGVLRTRSCDRTTGWCGPTLVQRPVTQGDVEVPSRGAAKPYSQGAMPPKPARHRRIPIGLLGGLRLGILGGAEPIHPATVLASRGRPSTAPRGHPGRVSLRLIGTADVPTRRLTRGRAISPRVGEAD
jgi:hypothetical protein